MKDQICGMELDKNSTFKSDYRGKTYYFCSKSCKDAFDKNASKYTR